MEIHNPAGGVTKGLLVVEMLSGNQKLGDAPTDTFGQTPAFVPVAGDARDVNPEAPTYYSFQSIATLNDPHSNRDPDRTGQSVGATIDVRSSRGTRRSLAAYVEQTRIVLYDAATGHNIPAVFWDFLTRRGSIVVDGRVETGGMVDWLSAMGYPITDPYWLRTKVAGVEQDVLVQLFERRVLSFAPSNAPGFRVEMGNVGQHYFQWRYPQLGQAWAANAPALPIFFASRRATPHWEVFRMSPEGDNQEQFMAGSGAERVPFSVQRADGGYDQTRVLVDSRRADGVYRQLYAVAFVNGSDILRLTYTDTSPPFPYSPYPAVTRPSNEYNAAVSPDGTKIAWVSDRAGDAQVFLMGWTPNAIGTVGDYVQLTTGECAKAAPSWSPDGRALVWMANGDGDWEIERGNLRYVEDRRGDARRYDVHHLQAVLFDVAKLTDNAANDTMPRWSPDGTAIAFASQREGNFKIYTMRVDGSNAEPLTSGSGDDDAPTWSPDGSQLAFSSNRDGDWEIYRVNIDGSRLKQLTSNTGDDNWPVWAQ